jgi:tRNA uridine 5-carbamoylmethylation protein Kti12
MSSAINMNYGYLQGYNNSLNMNQNVRQDSDGLVIKKNSNSTNEISNNTSSDTVLNKSDEENQKYSTNDNKLLTSDRVIELAVTKDMNKDTSLIGSESNLETLDVKKAISDMQRDKIIMEYQTFISNPATDDGFVKKIR